MRFVVVAALALAMALGAGAAKAQELSMVPVRIDGNTVRLEMRIYKPEGDARVPTLVYNHGSTGRGNDPSLFVRKVDFRDVAMFFVRRGWAAVMPMRRGRGGSEGEYDEGFGFPRTAGYTCDTAATIHGADRALGDIESAMDVILAMPFVDRDRVVMGGVSRGGILSVAYAGRRPEQIKGVINFVGGWLGSGFCSTSSYVNTMLFKRGARFPAETIWLYGDNDRFYPLAHSHDNFAAFKAAGGKGEFHDYVIPGDGHNLSSHPAAWGVVLEAYLTRLGLPSTPR